MKNTNEISIKEVIEAIRMYTKEIISKWYIPLLFALCLASILGYRAFKSPKQYSAPLRFIIEKNNSSSNAIAGLLGNLGLSNRGSGYISYRILEIAKSEQIIQPVLFKSLGNGDLIINRIINTYKFKEEWKKNNKSLLEVSFTHDSILNFTNEEKRAYYKIYEKTVGTNGSDPLIQIGYDGETTIFKLVSTTLDEELSYELTNSIYEEIRQFFEVTVFKNQQQSRDILKFKADSLKTLIVNKTISIAEFESNNSNLISRKPYSQKAILQTELQALSTAYAEMMKNYQLADFSLKTSKPFYIIIDRPFVPLKPLKPSFIKNIFIGTFLGGIIGIIIIVFRRFIINALK